MKLKNAFVASLVAGTLALASLSRPPRRIPWSAEQPCIPPRPSLRTPSTRPSTRPSSPAVKAAGLVDTLNGPGPFTVFAPTDDAFAKLPPGTVDTLVKPENKATLVKILTYHVVPGKITSKELRHDIKKGGGKYEMTTVEGGKLTASMSGDKIMLTDEKGGMPPSPSPTSTQSNGVIDVIDSVLMPN